MRSYRSTPEVNSGSMADIAFLLLIFFLVSTTIPNDKGIARLLPEKCPPGQDCNIPAAERNVLLIYLDEKGSLLVNDAPLALSELTETLKRFIDNNGDTSCDYCMGPGEQDSSDNPRKAVISLSSHPNVPYYNYIAVQNKLTTAYYELRESFVANVLQKDLGQLDASDIDAMKKAYPLIISEAEIK